MDEVVIKLLRKKSSCVVGAGRGAGRWFGGCQVDTIPELPGRTNRVPLLATMGHSNGQCPPGLQEVAVLFSGRLRGVVVNIQRQTA
jgi:hypothetical protein